MNTKLHFSCKSDNWATPQWLFDDLHREFKFTLDVCATPENAKCGLYFTKNKMGGGLAEDWQGICWMNPPYGREIGKWLGKAYSESLKGSTVVCLVPSKTDTKWWHDYCMKGEIRYLRGRVKFGGSPHNAPFASAVVIFRGTPK